MITSSFAWVWKGALFILGVLLLLWAWDHFDGHEPQLDVNGGGGNVTIELTPVFNINVSIDGSVLQGSEVLGPPAPTATAVAESSPTVSTDGNGAGNAVNVGITGGVGTSNGCGSDSEVACASTDMIPGTNIPAYAQTGTDDNAQWSFTVPQGYGMVLGGLQVAGSVNSANQPGNDIPKEEQGVLVAFPSGNHVSVNVLNGFYVLVPESDLGGKDGELCKRYKEAVSNGWSNGRVYTPRSWGEKPCG